ncbi:uncharacterized protein BT62DRAFT_997268 [Guyanagaster necrorhizus]|uniref:MYND-type domain-containing protein n=1 Tax=Guyanagaster necrorhizus TaxID=856835 RepID=A0A9P7VII7_9AGAR|nr:uncharacterized protein BT62DRAFT_997268 [Guyanagaster necrorhizus MCA 3950]KAG7441218.1 hypothetical protein BT62DRAFT_997268 [Guyanagaster necrorhizus MCA 3950]
MGSAKFGISLALSLLCSTLPPVKSAPAELALRGSGDALVQLGEFARDDSTVFPHFFQVIRVFLKYLPPPEMMDKLSPKDFFKSFNRPRSYFHALNVALQSPQALDLSKPAGLVITCRQIYLWAVKFFQHYLIDTNTLISMSVVSSTAVRIVEFLGTLATDPDYSAKMRDTKGFGFSMTVLWIYSIRAKYGRIEDSVKIIMMHILLKRTLDGEVSNAFNQVQNEISDAFNWVQNPIVELCPRIVASKREPDADYDGGIMFLVLSTAYSRPFTRAFISCHSVSWICRRIAGIAAKKEETCSPDELAVYSRLLQFSLFYLHEAFREGSDQIIEGLDADVIPALLKALSKVRAEDKKAILVPLLNLMTSYTLCRNVLVKMCKVLYTADFKPGISEAGPIGDAWTVLKETTETRCGILKDYIASGRELTKCSYPACPHPDNDPKRTLRRCQGCRFEYYCSKECQKLHWGGGHNDLCRRTQHDLRDILSMPMSKRELHFAYAIIGKDIQDNAQLIQKLKSEKRSGRGGFVVLITVMDYTQVPMKLYVLTDKEFHTTETVPAERWNTSLALAKEARKDLAPSPAFIPSDLKRANQNSHPTSPSEHSLAESALNPTQRVQTVSEYTIARTSGHIEDVSITADPSGPLRSRSINIKRPAALVLIDSWYTAKSLLLDRARHSGVSNTDPRPV